MNYYPMFFLGTFVACCCLHLAGAIWDIISLKDGKIGIDFLGNSASFGFVENPAGEGLGGGFEAEAGTIFGPKATAGFAGAIGPDSVGGNVFSHAQAIEGVHAGAGMAGGISPDEINGAVAKQAEIDLTRSRGKRF